MLLIGSRAEAAVLNASQPMSADIDVIASAAEAVELIKDIRAITGAYVPVSMGVGWIGVKYGSTNVDIHLAEGQTSTAQILKTDGGSRDIQVSIGGHELTFRCASLNTLFALKDSHKHNWNKFMSTRNAWFALRNAGATISDIEKEWHAKRIVETRKRKSYSHNVSKDIFFNDNEVGYVFDHDTIHLAVAIGALPAYTLFKKDGADVMCDRKKFESLDENIKIASVCEEAMVLAIERAHVPHGKMSEYDAYVFAVKKLCTTISSGWWQEYAWMNYEKVVGAYRPGYLACFWNAVNDGVVKKR